VSDATERLTAAFGRTPTTEEIAAELGCAAGDIAAATADVHRAVVLNYESLTAVEADDLLPADAATPDGIVLDNERTGYLVDAVATLPERLRRVIVGYYLDELPMARLADELGVTESRISQMRSEALALLRDGISAQLDPEHVEPAEKRSHRVTNRRDAYHRAIASRSTYRDRISSTGLRSLR